MQFFTSPNQILLGLDIGLGVLFQMVRKSLSTANKLPQFVKLLMHYLSV